MHVSSFIAAVNGQVNKKAPNNIFRRPYSVSCCIMARCCRVIIIIIIIIKHKQRVHIARTVALLALHF